MNKTLIKSAAINSFGVLVYVALIATLMHFIEKILGDTPDTIFAPIAVLLLFVTSAAITGYLVVGQPIMLFLEGKKAEAVKQFAYNIAFMILFTTLAVGANFLMAFF